MPLFFSNRINGELLICQINVDDIIFGSPNPPLCKKFATTMTKEFEISMMGTLKYFLGFQIEQFVEGTFISQTKYIKDMLTKFGMTDAKPWKTPMPTKGYLDQDLSGIPFDATLYRSMIGSFFTFVHLDRISCLV